MMTEYEIIADPKEYGIEKLVDGLNGNPVDFPPEERQQWAREVGAFAERLHELSDKATSLQSWLAGEAAIKSTPASLKTLKIQLFKINDALDKSLDLVNKLECDIVPCITDRP
jgi:septal ring factor EnvC (AmiA/AmiB activator)